MPGAGRRPAPVSLCPRLMCVTRRVCGRKVWGLPVCGCMHVLIFTPRSAIETEHLSHCCIFLKAACLCHLWGFIRLLIFLLMVRPLCMYYFYITNFTVISTFVLYCLTLFWII